MAVEVVKFISSEGGYRCNKPGDKAGEYVSVFDFEGMEARAETAESSLAAMRQRVEEAEESLRDFVSILSIPHPVESGTYRELLTTAFGRAKELLGVVPDPGASPPADASTMGRERERQYMEALSAYANDEDRYNRGEGEPYGSIQVEVGAIARQARAALAEMEQKP